MGERFTDALAEPLSSRKHLEAQELRFNLLCLSDGLPKISSCLWGAG
jgi:hypothetical protein